VNLGASNLYVSPLFLLPALSILFSAPYDTSVWNLRNETQGDRFRFGASYSSYHQARFSASISFSTRGASSRGRAAVANGAPAALLWMS